MVARVQDTNPEIVDAYLPASQPDAAADLGCHAAGCCMHRVNPARSSAPRLGAMRQSPLLEFESSAFVVEPGEDADTNPGIYGKALARWLTEQLRAQGVPAGDSIAEDFGWCVPIASRPHRLYVACANADDRTDLWRVFAFAEGGLMSRLFGTDKSEDSVASLFAAVKTALQSSPHVTRLREEAQ